MMQKCNSVKYRFMLIPPKSMISIEKDSKNPKHDCKLLFRFIHHNRRHTMIDKKQICQKIREIYPDIGACGIDVQVDYDATQKRWVVDLKKDAHELKTYLDPGDAEACLEGRQCVGLGIEIAQLRGNIERM